MHLFDASRPTADRKQGRPQTTGSLKRLWCKHNVWSCSESVLTVFTVIANWKKKEFLLFIFQTSNLLQIYSRMVHLHHSTPVRRWIINWVMVVVTEISKRKKRVYYRLKNSFLLKKFVFTTTFYIFRRIMRSNVLKINPNKRPTLVLNTRFRKLRFKQKHKFKNKITSCIKLVWSLCGLTVFDWEAPQKNRTFQNIMLRKIINTPSHTSNILLYIKCTRRGRVLL